MKKAYTIKYFMYFCIILFCLLAAKTIPVKAAMIESGYYEYDFETKKETYGKTSVLDTALLDNISEGSVGTLPYNPEPEAEPYSIVGEDGRKQVTDTTVIPVR